MNEIFLESIDQSEYGTNTSYLIDFVEFTLSSKFLKNEEIRHLYVDKGFSAAQIAGCFGVSKAAILARLHDLGIREGIRSKRSLNPENYRNRVPPYGFAIKQGRLVPNKSELRICRTVVELISRKHLSGTAAAKELSARGYKNRNGKTKWDHSSVLTIYRRWKDKF